MALGPVFADQLRRAVERIRDRMDTLAEQSPPIPLWDERRDTREDGGLK